MTNEEMLREINSLPLEGQHLVETFVAFLHQRYNNAPRQSLEQPMHNEGFIGMWKDREEMGNSSDWVKTIRESEWGQ